jgi:deoxycytidylate deaminase
MIFGANRTLPVSCKENGCLRVKKYGDDTKTHRNPDDCRALHSEIDAITFAARQGISTKGMILFVTRYPCEACARAIVAAGIERVIFGRQQYITDESFDILHSGGTIIMHLDYWDAEDVTY